MSLADAQVKIEARRVEYNESRPHSAPDWLTPAEFARQSALQGALVIPKKPEFSATERY